MLVDACRYILENYLHRKWTEDDVEKADLFFRYSPSKQSMTHRTLICHNVSMSAAGAMQCRLTALYCSDVDPDYC